MNIVINHHKDFKWLRFILLALKNNHYVENKKEFFHREDHVSHTQELVITETEAIFTERDEDSDTISITKITWKRGKNGAGTQVKELWYKTKAGVERAKANFAKYLEQNPNMREWGAKRGSKEYLCLES